jgi:hypothetical protein
LHELEHLRGGWLLDNVAQGAARSLVDGILRAEPPRRVRRNIRVESASGDADKGGTQLQVEVRSP